MILLETALAVVSDRVPLTYEDKIEAYHFINDYGYNDKLTEQQQKELEDLVERGIVETPIWQPAVITTK